MYVCTGGRHPAYTSVKGSFYIIDASEHHVLESIYI